MVSGDDLKRKTLISTIFLYAGNFGATGINFVILMVLARILTPIDFGLVAMVTIFTSFFLMVLDFGLSTALIQQKRVDNKLLNSIFEINMAFGLLLGFLLWMGTNLIVNFYDEPRLIPIIKYVALTFVFQSIGEVSYTMLRREMKFGMIALIDILKVTVYGIVSIIFALLGFGVLSLVWGTLAGILTMSFVTLWLFHWPIRLVNPKHARKVLSFGFFVTGADLVNYLAANTDRILIGKYLGSGPLGLYEFTHHLISLPVRKIARAIQKTTFSAFAIIQDSDEVLRRGYNRLVSVVSYITFPLLTGLIICADPLILIIFGDQWIDAVDLIRILSIAGAFKCIGAVRANAFLSKNRPDISFRLQILYFFLLLIAVIGGLSWWKNVGIQWGVSEGLSWGFLPWDVIGKPQWSIAACPRWDLIPIATAVVIAALTSFMVNQHYINKLLQEKMKSFVKSISPAVLQSITVILLWFCLTFYEISFFQLNIFLLLSIKIVGVSGVYLILMFTIWKSQTLGIIDELRDALKSEV